MRRNLIALLLVSIAHGGLATDQAAAIDVSVPGQGLGQAGHTVQMACKSNREKAIVHGKVSNMRPVDHYRQQAHAEWKRAVSRRHGQAYAQWSLAQNRLERCVPGRNRHVHCAIAGNPCTLKR